MKLSLSYRVLLYGHCVLHVESVCSADVTLTLKGVWVMQFNSIRNIFIGVECNIAEYINIYYTFVFG